MKKAQLLSEILGDFLLPLLGFLFWGWDLYFILLFIIFDLSVRLISAFFRPESRQLQLLLRPVLFYLTFFLYLQDACANTKIIFLCLNES